MTRKNPVSRAAYKLAKHVYQVLRTAFPQNRVGFETFEDPDYIQITFQGPKVDGKRLWGEDFLVIAEEKRQEWLEGGDASMEDVVILPMGYALVFSKDAGLAKTLGREVALSARKNPGRASMPPGFHGAMRAFRAFHQYEPENVAAFPESLVIPDEVYYPGPCTYVTYRSDKWNDGTHDYIHEIESFPKVNVGMVSERHPRTKRVPKRLGNNTTVTQLQIKALGYGWLNLDDDVNVDTTVRNCEWFWHPGKALLLIQSKRKLLAIIWGGGLDWKPQGLVG